MNKFIKYLFIIVVCISGSVCFAQEYNVKASAQEAFSKPKLLSNKELYDAARQALAVGKLDDSRLYALRMFMDGVRNQNLLNLLGVIEFQSGNQLLAGEWFRRASALKLTNKVGQKYLSRLPAKVLPIPVDPAKLADHFSEITNALPKLLEKLTNAKLHKEAILKALERGQIYFALAIAEEYEKKYKDVDGPALAALCAWYLGRNLDALTAVNQNLQQNPYHPILLFVKAMISDGHPATSSGNYFKALYDLDQWNKIFEIADKYNETHPNSAEAYIIKTRILLDMNKTKEAAESLEEAGKRDPGSPEVELLWVNYMLQRGDTEKAQKRINKAYRRGYNLPEVNLTSGLFAIQEGRVNELSMVANEATSCRPFSDVDSYAIYVSILMVMEEFDAARNALDEWHSRFPEKSVYCYLESCFYFKKNNVKQALFWLRRAFKANPNRIDMLKTIVKFPALEQDEELFKEISKRIADSASDASELVKANKVEDAEVLPSDNKKSNKGNKKSNGGKAKSGTTKFNIVSNTGFEESYEAMFKSEISRIYGILADAIGDAKEPIEIDIQSSEGKGPLIATTNNEGMILVTSNFYDTSMVQNIIVANVDNFSDAELYPLIEEYPGSVLASEIAKKMIRQIVPESRKSKEKNFWMQIGLSDILASVTSEQSLTIRYRLVLANKSINEKTAALTSINSLNVLCSDTYASPAVSETARAQAYLMTAYLIKKVGFKQGCQNMIELIKQTSNNVEFPVALQKVFGISEKDFEKKWKESAEWALSNGAPYEWE